MKFKFFSIKTQIILTLLTVMSGVFALLILNTSQQMKELPNIYLSNYREIAQSRANELGHEIHGMQSQVEMIALSNVVESLVLEDIQAYLRSIARQDYFRSFTYANQEGIAWSTYDMVIDITQQEQYKEIFINGKLAYMSRPFLSPFIQGTDPIITISHAIRKEDELVGLVNGIVHTSFIDRLLESITIQEEGFAYIIDDRGQIVAHPDVRYGIDQSFYDITQLDFVQLSDQNTQSFDFVLDGVDFVGIFADIPYTEGWKLILNIHRHDAFGWITRMMDAMYLSLGGALLILLSVLIASTNAIIRPLLKFKDTFDEAKQGNLNVRADESVRNEVGEVAKSFNSMLDQIKALTYRDPITGLNNFFSFMNETPRLLQQLKDEDDKLFIVIVSIDDFKLINSLYGYDIGNATLCALSSVIQTFLHEKEIMARYFGDEMILSLIDKDSIAIERRITSLLEELKKPLRVESLDIHLNVSCGIAEYNKEKELNHVIRQSTLAKHRAKLDSNNRFETYSEVFYQDLLDEQHLKEALQTALLNEEFYLVFQAIHSIKTEKTIGYEALLRWNHEAYQKISIAEIIRLAEQIGMIPEIGQFVLLKAAEKLIQLNEMDPQLKVSINVSPLQLQNDKFLIFAKQCIDSLQFNPHNLIIEITESSTMLDVDQKKDILGRFKALGFEIAIDDFGTGYSSLMYIAKLPIDIIKIDREFISKIVFDEYSKVLIVSILSIAQTLKLRVIAEGVETTEQLEALRELGGQYVQGYLIAKPIILDN